jgi:hypothetical protein
MDYSSKLSTNHLSHFTKTFENLKNIVQNGFKPNICKELAIDERPTENQRIFMKLFAELFDEEETEHKNVKHYIPMVCFCDIPPKFAKTHRKIYGQYGILLTKEWAITRGVSPIIYLPENSKLHAIFYNINRIVKDAINRYSEAVLIKDDIRKLREYIKPYVEDNKKYKYYDEREWRYIPNASDPDIDNTYLTFEKRDFVGAIVQTTGEKNELLNILNEKFGGRKSFKITVYKEYHYLKNTI